MIRLYCWLNAVIYALFGVATMLNPDRMARAAGFYTLDNSGSSEFLTIYAGLELGLAAFYVAAARDAVRARFAIFFSLWYYAGIVLFRLPSLAIYNPVRPVTWALAAGEVVLLVSAAILLARSRRAPEEELS
jgi:hypothetical protein